MANYTVKRLRELLSEHNDCEQIHFGIVFDEKHEYVEKLEKMLKEAYDLLLSAEDCVSYVAKQEKRQKENLIFYDGRGKGNKGAKLLKKDIEEFTSSYSERLLRASIES